MTSLPGILATLAIILIDLLGRAGLDKVLALTGDPTMVALWAQAQSVVELVYAVALAGVLQGLTVLVAQVREARDERGVLRAALKLGLGVSMAAALLVALASPLFSSWLTQDRIAPSLLLLAAACGCLAVLPATLNAYWLGKHQQQRMLVLSLFTGAVWLLVAAGAWAGYALDGLLLVQCGALLLVAALVWRHLRRLAQGVQDDGHFRKLARFVPAGLAIGIMSPVSMLLIRGMLSGSLSWNDVGLLQALWRASDWVTATAAGALSLIFLPRLGSAWASGRFGKEVLNAGLAVLLPSACLLWLIWFNQRAMLAVLYDSRFAVSDTAAALFLIGCWVRIASWVFLNGLFAAHRTWAIAAGEMLSLPLLALLLHLFAEGMTLERAALIYLAAYLVYLAFNAGALLYASRAPAPELGR